MSSPDSRVSVEEIYPDDANPALVAELFRLADEAEEEAETFDRDFEEWAAERHSEVLHDFDHLSGDYFWDRRG